MIELSRAVIDRLLLQLLALVLERQATHKTGVSQVAMRDGHADLADLRSLTPLGEKVRLVS